MKVLGTVLCVLATISTSQAFENNNNIPLNESLFEEIVIEENLKDGYWIDAIDINGDGRKDIVAYGLASGAVTTYINPIDNGKWEKNIIANLKQPVGMNVYDVDKDGLDDIIITYRYGTTMANTDKSGGHIIWLKNPNDKNKKWAQHYIGRDIGMHRMAIGHFTSQSKKQLITLPVVGNGPGIREPIPIAIYDIPTSPESVESWNKDVINTGTFRLLHDASITPNKHSQGLDSILVSSEEGIHWLYYKDRKWNIEKVSNGDVSPQQYKFSYNFFKGSNSSVEIKENISRKSFIISLEPFHGSKLVSYKINNKTIDRTVLFDFQNIDKQGFGAGHHLLSHDFNGDGADEVIASFPKKPQGIILAELDLKNKGSFKLTRISNKSSARVVKADFNNDGNMDFASISYNVPGYYEDKNPNIRIYLNRN
ncbi:exported hypothetical protein [Vibrio nigripulchritudo MADA3029]|uniref:FG-GAP repeat domain-containing protein n=1 Tax=Vibrio nigripulchritudo TaxID=28173 RepID=UPI0003B1DAE9|nr:VCBS repeat-containing protein [Vibrio nigripulchritudo]CCN54440.1 exported hypothetical protein [Vibrio nigripulchritudo MADA3021]CCN57490.1 exported hypothetical protein [Vibrio nigripulchritudo MADA3029]